ncbi:MAG: hypothetical protein AB8G05_03890 [Oligoflexales bacterium]
MQKSLTWKDSFDVVSPTDYQTLSDLNFRSPFLDYQDYFKNKLINCRNTNRQISAIVRFNQSQICGYFTIKLIDLPQISLGENFPLALPLKVWNIERLCKNSNLIIPAIDQMGKLLLALAIRAMIETQKTNVVVINPVKFSAETLNSFKSLGFRSLGNKNLLFYKLPFSVAPEKIREN